MSRLTITLALIFVAAVWGFAFVPQRQAMTYLGPLTYTGVRFLLGAVIVYCVFSKDIRFHVRKYPRQTLLGGLAMGLCLTTAVTLQQWGLLWTTAGKAGFLTGAYVSVVPLIGLLLGQHPNRFEWAAVGLVVIGSYLLADLSELSFNVGDLLVCICAVFWALHVQTVGVASKHASPTTLACIQFLTCGALATMGGLVFEKPTQSALLDCWWPILYGGAVSVGIAYTLQVVIQRWADATDAAIILSSEAVFAAFFGWLILNEEMSLRGGFGCLLLIIATLVTQLSPSPAVKPA